MYRIERKAAPQLSLLVAIMLLFSGCTQEQTRIPTASLASKSQQLSHEEIASFEKVAWEAVNSTAVLERFKPERISKEPFEFSREGMQCYLEPKTFATVEVAVPSGGQFGYHGCFVGVTLDRSSHEVLSMRESFWPFRLVLDPTKSADLVKRRPLFKQTNKAWMTEGVSPGEKPVAPPEGPKEKPGKSREDDAGGPSRRS